MADKPLYGGAGKSSPMYYGSSKPMYGAGSPMYYGASRQYGAQYGQYGGQYGQYGQYGGVAPDDRSVVGTLTLSRILRVVSQRWLSVFVFLLIGLIVSFAVYSISPEIFESTSEFTMDIRRNAAKASSAIDQAMADYGNNYAEIFNTRLPQWRSEAIVKKIQDAYRSKAPTSTVSDEEIVRTLADSEIELQRNSRIITISVRSRNKDLAMALAYAYVQSIENFTDEENKVRCDKAVSQLHEQVEKSRREKDQLATDLQEFRTTHKVDNLRSQMDIVKQSISSTTSTILELETQEKELGEWSKLLAAVAKDPERFGSLSVNAPRAQEIAAEYKEFQSRSAEYNKLLNTFNEKHPDVINKAGELEAAKKRFLDATARAQETGVSMLEVAKNRLKSLKEKQNQLQAEVANLSQRINLAESKLSTLESEYQIASHLFESLVLDEQKARNEAESNNETINIGRPATLPGKPVLPNPILIFGVGVSLSLLLGFVFVLILDNLEDTVVNLSDIEVRLSLKVLAVLPHVRRKKREHVAMYTIEDKYSAFSESVAGLRNLLDSPRYEAMSHCMLVISTQPGEGKTITSTSVAISYAQTGRKVLHVDFDLRRPRLYRVWNIELTEEKSFSHSLQNAGGKKIDFSALVNKTSVDNLDAICSLPPDGVTPATIFGSSIVSDFFAWARENYDRIIVDSPPYGVVGDVVSLAVQVDSVLIMCCPDRTHFKPIQYCSRVLTEAGANILGVIVNDVEVSNTSAFSLGNSHHSYGYNYGYGYGYGYGSNRYISHRRRGDGDNPATEPQSPPPADAAGGITASMDEESPVVDPPVQSGDNDDFSDDD